MGAAFIKRNGHYNLKSIIVDPIAIASSMSFHTRLIHPFLIPDDTVNFRPVLPTFRETCPILRRIRMKGVFQITHLQL